VPLHVDQRDHLTEAVRQCGQRVGDDRMERFADGKSLGISLPGPAVAANRSKAAS
jgi:hypothetical protein